MPQNTELRLLIVDNAADARAIREKIESVDSSAFRIHCAETLVSSLNALAHHTFDVVLMDLSLADSQGLPTFETILRHTHGLPIVIHTGAANEAMALAAVGGGAQDYLAKGKTPGPALVRVLQYAFARHLGRSHTAAPPPVEARVVGVMGAKGGVGATTFATHFSVELSKQTGAKTLLLDLDSSSRSAAFLLGTESRYTVADAATNLHRLDADFWGGVVATTPDGLDLLQAPGAIGFAEPLTGDRVRHVLRFARQLYRFIVVDLGRLTTLSLSLQEEIRELYLVATSGIPELYETRRVFQKLHESGFEPNRVRMVFSRVSKPSFFSSSAIRDALGVPPFCVIPDCTADLEEAYANKRFLDEKLAIRKQVARAVAKSLGAEPKAPTRGLAGLFRLARA